jgi:hypothetical protein
MGCKVIIGLLTVTLAVGIYAQTELPCVETMRMQTHGRSYRLRCGAVLTMQKS